jgi:hypothetical protein
MEARQEASMLERLTPALYEMIRVGLFFAAGAALMMALLWLR